MRRLLARLPTSTLVGLAFTVPAALLAAGLVGYNRHVARRYLEREGARYADVLAEPILSASQRFLREGSIAPIQEMIEDTGSSRTVESLALIGGDGRILAANRREWIGRDESIIPEPAYAAVAAAARTDLQTRRAPADAGRRLVVVSPLLFQGSSPILASGNRGVLYMKINHEARLREMSAGILERAAWAAAGILSMSLLLLVWVRAVLTRPILAVAAYLRAVAGGRAEPAPASAGPREVAQLIADVQGLAADLETKERELRASEVRLREAQRMESVAGLAGSLAHDFNNLLTAILGYARLLLDRVGPKDPIRRQLAAIETTAARAADLTGRLLIFSRRAAGRPAPADAAAVLDPALKEVRRDLPPGIEMRVDGAEGLWPAALDAAQIRRVLRALCDNAVEAMGPRGRLTVTFGNRAVAAEECRGRAEARAGCFVTFAVADTGPGLDEEVRRRLFEPFVTTKKKGAGAAGFGLATAYGLVKGHEGWIDVASAAGRGTVFTVHLPAGDPGAAPASGPLPAPDPEPAPAAAPATSAATVLAVDDESSVLALARDALEMNGYRVLTARHGEEALRAYREHPGEIQVVLLDLSMPVMGGVECFRRLREIDPGVRVIISSGFSSESTAAEVLRDGTVDFLQKPYDIRALVRVVADALARPAGAMRAEPDAAAG